jgi:hypothetical protein
VNCHYFTSYVLWSHCKLWISKNKTKQSILISPSSQEKCRLGFLQASASADCPPVSVSPCSYVSAKATLFNIRCRFCPFCTWLTVLTLVPGPCISTVLLPLFYMPKKFKL